MHQSGVEGRLENSRTSVREFMADLVPPGWRGIGELSGESREEFRNGARAALVQRRWIAPHWPVQYGGAGLGPGELIALREELSLAGIPFGAHDHAFGVTMLGNTMLRWCSDELLHEFLPKIISREYVFAQVFSEPGAGSDLASLSLCAELHGDRWVLNGQKLWSSDAHRANWMFVLARIDREATRHRGITMLLVPLDQPGIEIRPIRNIGGDTDFNEVFFDDVLTARDLVVGEVNGGWPVAMTLLGFERGDAALHTPIRLRNELDRLIAVAFERNLHNDPDVRRRIARCHVQVEQLRWRPIRPARGRRSISTLVRAPSTLTRPKFSGGLSVSCSRAYRNSRRPAQRVGFGRGHRDNRIRGFGQNRSGPFGRILPARRRGKGTVKFP
jgi:alkylation response protein AidB-like acyl-CoA dehydrogenase